MPVPLELLDALDLGMHPAKAVVGEWQGLARRGTGGRRVLARGGRGLGSILAGGGYQLAEFQFELVGQLAAALGGGVEPVMLELGGEQLEMNRHLIGDSRRFAAGNREAPSFPS